jgi:hypothetical protein
VEPDPPRHDLSAACVIAQQYSSATSISLHFHSRKEKFGAPLKNIISIFFYFLKIAQIGECLYTGPDSITGLHVGKSKKKIMPLLEL